MILRAKNVLMVIVYVEKAGLYLKIKIHVLNFIMNVILLVMIVFKEFVFVMWGQFIFLNSLNVYLNVENSAKIVSWKIGAIYAFKVMIISVINVILIRHVRIDGQWLIIFVNHLFVIKLALNVIMVIVNAIMDFFGAMMELFVSKNVILHVKIAKMESVNVMKKNTMTLTLKNV